MKERNLPLKPVVEDAEIKLPTVLVALTWKREVVLREAVVVAPIATDLVEVELMKLAVKVSQTWPKEAPPLASSPSQSPAEPVIVTQKSSKELPVTPPRVKFAMPTILPAESIVEVAELPILKEFPVKRLAKELVEVAEVEVERVMLSKM